MTRLPSVRTLAAVFGDNAKEARRVLEMTRTDLEATPAGAARVRQCCNPPTTRDVRLHVLDALAATHGVEAFETRRLGWCEYLNAGDTYTPTLLHFNGSYRVACWGDIVEKHGAVD